MTTAGAAQPEEKNWTINALIAKVRRRLQAAGIGSADQEALWLFEHALGLSALQQVIEGDRLLSQEDITSVMTIVDRRTAREPLQYILGTQEFCGLDFEVDATVLIPRPETELLVSEVIRRLPQSKTPTIVDVGTGSGCLAVTLARRIPSGKLLAIDRSAQALETAKRNARRHAVEMSITWLEGDLLAPLARHGLEKSVMAVVSNPPYIPEADWSGLQPEVCRYEPRSALVAGPQGTELHERLLDEATPYLVPGGFLAMELGQGQSVSLTAKARRMAAYESVEIIRDDAGIDRMLIATRVG